MPQQDLEHAYAAHPAGEAAEGGRRQSIILELRIQPE